MTAKIIWKRRKAAFCYPVGIPPRTAILVPWFDVKMTDIKSFANKGLEAWRSDPQSISLNKLRSSSVVRIFPDGWDSEADAFSPEAIVGTSAQLLDLATPRPERPVPHLTHAVIAVARLGEPLLTTEQRDELWQAFQVPTFEQVIGPRGVLLAAECEAHDGLHDEAEEMEWRGLTIDTSPCPCGLTTPRLRPVAAPIPAPARTRAASSAAR